MTDEILEQPEVTTEVQEPTDEQGDEQTRLEAEEAERREQEGPVAGEEPEWFKKRFDKITRQKYEEREARLMAEKRAKELEERIQALENKGKPQQVQPTRPKPKLSEFTAKHENIDDATEAWGDAIAAWNVEQYDARQRVARQTEEQNRQRQEQARTYEQKVTAIQRAGQEKHADWLQVVDSIPKEIMHERLASAILEIPHGELIAYYFGKNLQEAERISQLPPYAMAAELGKIETKLSQKQTTKSNAPPPVSTVKAATPTTTLPDPDKDPIGYIDARNRGLI